MHPWATSIVRGNVTEVTILTPVKRGLIPGELRTYEERLRTLLASLNDRANNNVPTPISMIATIHFARWFLVRPEQYLRYSQIPGLRYEGDGKPPNDPTASRPTLPHNVPVDYEPDYRPAGSGGEPFVLPTWLIFTSNYDYNEEGDWTDPDSLPVRLGVRMFSRLHEMCELHKLDGADYREMPVNGGPDELRALWKIRRDRARGLRATGPRGSAGRQLPARTAGQARGRMSDDSVELKWSGGRAGN